MAGLVNHLYHRVVFTDWERQDKNIRYSGVNCALRPSKSIRYSEDFAIAGFVMAGLINNNDNNNEFFYSAKTIKNIQKRFTII